MPTTSTMLADVSDNLVYSAIAVYALAMLTYAALAARGTRTAVPEPAAANVLAGSPSSASPIDAVTPHSPATGWDQTARVGASLTVLAFLLHAAGVVARGIAAGRAPWGNMYEFALVGSLAAAGAFLVFLRRHPVSPLGVWLLAIVLLALGLGVTVLYAPAGDLIPVLDSYWLVIHVAAAIVAGGTFTVGAVATVAFLVAERTERRSSDDADARRTHRRLPPASSLSDISHAAHLFAFPIWTFAVIAGAIWAENSWGRYWGWDPKETWAFITFVFYAAHLHAESTAGWRGRRAAYLALLGYAAFLFNFFGVNMWISGLHSYAGV